MIEGIKQHVPIEKSHFLSRMSVGQLKPISMLIISEKPNVIPIQKALRQLIKTVVQSAPCEFLPQRFPYTPQRPLSMDKRGNHVAKLLAFLEHSTRIQPGEVFSPRFDPYQRLRVDCGFGERSLEEHISELPTRPVVPVDAEWVMALTRPLFWHSLDGYRMDVLREYTECAFGSEPKKPVLLSFREIVLMAKNAAEQAFFSNLRHLAKKGKTLDGETAVPAHLPNKCGFENDACEQIVFQNRIKAARYVYATLDRQSNTRSLCHQSLESSMCDRRGGDSQFANAVYENLLESMQKSDTGGDAQVAQKIKVIRPTKNYRVRTNTYNCLTHEGAAILVQELNNIQRYREASVHETLSALPRGTRFELCEMQMDTTTNRTDASPLERLIKQPYFSNVRGIRNQKILIFDDHSEAGGFAASMLSLVKSKGAQVVGLVTLTSSPYVASSLYAKDEQIDHLKHLLNKNGFSVFSKKNVSSRKLAFLNKSLKRRTLQSPAAYLSDNLAHIGLGFDTLTAYEASVLIALLTDGGDKSAVSKFYEVDQKAQNGFSYIMSLSDTSPCRVVKNPRMTADQIVAALSGKLAEAR